MYFIKLGCFFISNSFVLLAVYSMLHCFKYQYVYEHTSLDLPLIYRLSALWAGKEGSFLLWAMIAVLMASMILKKSPKVYSIFGSITVILVVMAFFMNPFKKMSEILTDGLGLAQALQDPWMVVHPPLVFMGYTVMAILLAVGFEDQSLEIKRWMRWRIL